MNMVLNSVIAICCFGIAINLAEDHLYGLSLGYVGLMVAYIGFAWAFAP
jgi:hypothetical protein